MKKILLFIITFYGTLSLFAQKHDNVWISGYSGKIGGDPNNGQTQITFARKALKKFNNLVKSSPGIFKIAKSGSNMSIGDNGRKQLEIYLNLSKGVFQLDVSGRSKRLSKGTYLLRIKSAE